MKLLGLAGKKQTGKDTVAGFLKKQLAPEQVIRLGFADALKGEIARAVGRDVRYIEEHKDNFRLILQGWGTDFRRKLCSDSYWIEKMLHKLLSLDENAISLVIITDVRFLNEAELVRNAGGKIWRIVRDRAGSAEDKHPSEVELEQIQADYTLYNNHFLTELQHNIQLAYQQTLL